MRIAVVGFGGVGKAFVKLISEKKQYLEGQGLYLTINYILNSRGGIYDPKGIDLEGLSSFIDGGEELSDYREGWSNELNFNSIADNRDVDIVIEVTPTNKETGEPAMTHIRRSLERGIHVITANKGPVLLAYRKLKNLADKNNVQLCIGCTTGGALPAVNAGLIDMAGAEILSIEGILNGTTNFILEEMEREGCTYKEALKKAQQLGIAEADPSLDVEGWDTASKLLILANVLMNQEKTLAEIHVRGITEITPEEVNAAKEKGERIKLVGRAVREDKGLEITIQPENLAYNHALCGVCGKNKAVRYTSDTLGDLTVMGGASGTIPAAASLLRDLINIYKGYKY